MLKLSMLLLIGVAAACAEDAAFVAPSAVLPAPTLRSPGWNRSESLKQPYRNLWLTSVTALAVANTLDVHSSWGKHELNQALAGPSGNFGREGAMLKAALQGGLLGFEYLIMRHHPNGKLNKVLSIVNFGAAAAVGGVAAHNYSIPRAR